MMDIVWAFIKGSRNTILPIVTGIVGFLIGLFLFGWYLTPVQYVDGAPNQLRNEDYMQFYLRGVASDFALTNSGDFANSATASWSTEELKIYLCDAETKAQNGYVLSNGQQVPPDPGAFERVFALRSQVIPNVDCSQEPPLQDYLEAQSSGLLSRSALITCLLGVLLIALFGLFFAVLSRRSGGVDVDNVFAPRNNVLPTEDVVTSGDSEGGGASEVIPIASYRTEFTYGNDVFDQSFQIENANGDFLGECGVDISESIGNDSPKHVTAIEVWLFDKQDIRTITKVAMSDHAYFDEVLRAKLATKGEQVLARPSEVIVLETAALIINAKITDLEYGADPGYPNQSYFDRFAVEISAWAKGDAATASSGSDFDFGEDFYS